MLRDDVDRYTKLTGEDGWHVPISTISAYLDGYDKGLEVLDKIRAEIERERSFQRAIDEYDIATGLRKALEIFDKYKAERGNKG